MQILGADVVFEHDSDKTLRKNISLIHAANKTFTTLVETLVALTDPAYPSGAPGSATLDAAASGADAPSVEPPVSTAAPVVLIAHKHRYMQREMRFHEMMAECVSVRSAVAARATRVVIV